LNSERLRRLPLLLLLLTLPACPARTTSTSVQTATEDPELLAPPTEGRFAAEGPTASMYGMRNPVQLTGLEARVIASLRRLASELRRPFIEADAAAMAMARDVCLGLAPQGPPPSKLVNFAMESNGLTEPPPHFVVANMPFGAESSMISELEVRLREILEQGTYRRVGVSVQVPRLGTDGRRLLVALMESRVTITPMPRRLKSGQEATLSARPGQGISGLRMVVADPKGKITTTPLKNGSAHFACMNRGVYQVELTGEAEYGVEVLANFPVYCNADPPTEVRYALTTGADQTVEGVERDILQRTNAIRLKRGLPVFRPNLQLAGIARAHSTDMRDNSFVGHVSPITGTPSDRLRKAGLTHLLSRENVARGYSVEEIMTGLMDSPAHRENLLSRDITEVGVGVAVDRSSTPPVLLVTQDFIKSGTALIPSAGARPVLAEVARLRLDAGVKALIRDPELAGIAARVAETLGQGGDDAEELARKRLDKDLDGLGTRFKQVDSLVAKLSAVEALAQAPELVRARYTHLGVAMGGEPGKILLIVLLGVTR